MIQTAHTTIPCTHDSTTPTKIVCTATSSQMTANTNYTIQYKKTCTSDYVDTGVAVGFVLKASTDSSSMMRFSKLSLVLALFLF